MQGGAELQCDGPWVKADVSAPEAQALDLRQCIALER